MSESNAHLELKFFVLGWAQEMGFSCAALEVGVPFSSFRADVAAYRPQSSSFSKVPGETVIFECKQSRTDLLRDSAETAPALERLSFLHMRRKRLEQLLRPHYPTLPCGDSLFPEYESLDFSTLRHRGYRQTIRELQSRVMKQTKFERLIKFPRAIFHYLVVKKGILASHECPEGWGILEQQGEKLTLMRKTPHHNASDAARLSLLQKVALAGTQAWKRQLRNFIQK